MNEKENIWCNAKKKKATAEAKKVLKIVPEIKEKLLLIDYNKLIEEMPQKVVIRSNYIGFNVFDMLKYAYSIWKEETIPAGIEEKRAQWVVEEVYHKNYDELKDCPTVRIFENRFLAYLNEYISQNTAKYGMLCAEQITFQELIKLLEKIEKKQYDFDLEKEKDLVEILVLEKQILYAVDKLKDMDGFVFGEVYKILNQKLNYTKNFELMESYAKTPYN